jgi:hypothetical protein
MEGAAWPPPCFFPLRRGSKRAAGLSKNFDRKVQIIVLKKERQPLGKKREHGKIA